jgi:hypothetical protein
VTDSKPITSTDPSTRSPFAGCAILIVALAVMVFLIGFSILTLFRQFNEIAKFTGEQPAPVAISSLEGQEPALNDLGERLEKFRQQLADGTAATLELSVEDINFAIAGYESFKELRGTFRVLSMEEDAIQAAISFELNGKPRMTRDGEPGFVTSDSRYLNGTLIAKPNLLKREVVLPLESIVVPGKKVAPEFIDQMSPYRITERYLSDPVIGPAMAKLTRVAISDGKLVLTRNPNETPVDMISDAQVDSASTRLFTVFGIAATVFLAFAGVIVWIGVRAKTRKAKES